MNTRLIEIFFAKAPLFYSVVGSSSSDVIFHFLMLPYYYIPKLFNRNWQTVLKCLFVENLIKSCFNPLFSILCIRSSYLANENWTLVFFLKWCTNWDLSILGIGGQFWDKKFFFLRIFHDFKGEKKIFISELTENS